MQLSRKLFDTMLEAGFSVATLSKQSGISRTTIAKMIRDQRVMPLQAHAVCKALSEKLGRAVTPGELEIVVKEPKQ